MTQPDYPSILHSALGTVCLLTGTTSGVALKPQELRAALHDPAQPLHAVLSVSGPRQGAVPTEEVRSHREETRTLYLRTQGERHFLVEEPPGSQYSSGHWAAFSSHQAATWLDEATTLVQEQVEARLNMLSAEVHVDVAAGTPTTTWLKSALPTNLHLADAVLNAKSSRRGKVFRDEAGFMIVTALGDYLYIACSSTLADLAPHAQALRALGLIKGG